jgi:hypothetical protein
MGKCNHVGPVNNKQKVMGSLHLIGDISVICPKSSSFRLATFHVFMAFQDLH